MSNFRHKKSNPNDIITYVKFLKIEIPCHPIKDNNACNFISEDKSYFHTYHGDNTQLNTIVDFFINFTYSMSDFEHRISENFQRMETRLLNLEQKLSLIDRIRENNDYIVNQSKIQTEKIDKFIYQLGKFLSRNDIRDLTQQILKSAGMMNDYPKKIEIETKELIQKQYLLFKEELDHAIGLISKVHDMMKVESASGILGTAPL